jgi:hypothetical protein
MAILNCLQLFVLFEDFCGWELIQIQLEDVADVEKVKGVEPILCIFLESPEAFSRVLVVSVSHVFNVSVSFERVKI